MHEEAEWMMRVTTKQERANLKYSVLWISKSVAPAQRRSTRADTQTPAAQLTRPRGVTDKTYKLSATSLLSEFRIS